MTQYNIIVSCPELSLSNTIYTLNLPVIKFDDVEVTELFVTKAVDKLSSINKAVLKSALMELIEQTVAASGI